MADALIKVSEPAVADKNVDTESLVGAGGATVQRERVQICGASLTAVSSVLSSAPAGTEFGLVTRPIVSTLPLPTGAATSALQTQPGVDIGDVTVNNAGGAAAVN